MYLLAFLHPSDVAKMEMVSKGWHICLRTPAMAKHVWKGVAQTLFPFLRDLKTSLLAEKRRPQEWKQDIENKIIKLKLSKPNSDKKSKEEKGEERINTRRLMVENDHEEEEEEDDDEEEEEEEEEEEKDEEKGEEDEGKQEGRKNYEIVVEKKKEHEDEEKDYEGEHFIYWKALTRYLMLASASARHKLNVLSKKAEGAVKREPLVILGNLLMQLRGEEMLRGQLAAKIQACRQENMKLGGEVGEEQRRGFEKGCELFMRGLQYCRVANVHSHEWNEENYKWDLRTVTEIEGYLLGRKGFSLRFLGREEECGTYESYFTIYSLRMTILSTARMLKDMEMPRSILDTIDDDEEQQGQEHRGLSLRAANCQFHEWEWELMRHVLGFDDDDDEELLSLSAFKALVISCTRPTGRYCSSGSIGFRTDHSLSLSSLSGFMRWA